MGKLCFNSSKLELPQTGKYQFLIFFKTFKFLQFYFSQLNQVPFISASVTPTKTSVIQSLQNTLHERMAQSWTCVVSCVGEFLTKLALQMETVLTHSFK